MVRIGARIIAPVLLLAASQAWAQTTTLPGYGYPTPPSGGSGSAAACPRPVPGSLVLPPPDIYSFQGLLSVKIEYNTTVDTSVTPNRTLFCFQADPFGWEGPTLRINPGDTLALNITNNVPASGTVVETVSTTDEQCGSLIRTPETLNIHYHGAPVSPACGQDQVIHTMIDSGQSFQYFIPWPYYTPPGLYWWHHHVHGNADPAVKGGASAALIVGGIQNFFPWLTGIRERVLVLRDQGTVTGGATSLAGNAACPGTNGSNGQVAASSDLTINYVPLNTSSADCSYTPAVIEAIPSGYELWRVANAAADTIIDLTLVDQNGNQQPLLLVAIDGVPTGTELAHQLGTPVSTNDVLLAPAARSEFVVPTPPPGQTWKFVANHISFAGGLGGEGVGGFGFQSTQTRTLAQVKTDRPSFLPLIPPPTYFVPPSIPASQQLINQTPTVYRSFFFDEPPTGEPATSEAVGNGINGLFFFIMAVVNQDGTINEEPFDVSNPPAVVSTQGTIEQWTVANHTQENHEFHFHQLRFLVLSQNNYPTDPATGKPYPFGIQAPYEVGQYLDMIQVPAAPDSFFSPTNPPGLFKNFTPPSGASPPSVTFRLDFTGSDIGDFVFHCHILGHEDAGMMQIIRVVPPVAP
jgi:FtsP/CotA-like multicopper oxidase with cupredoxin domain